MLNVQCQSGWSNLILRMHKERFRTSDPDCATDKEALEELRIRVKKVIWMS